MRLLTAVNIHWVPRPGPIVVKGQLLGPSGTEPLKTPSLAFEHLRRSGLHPGLTAERAGTLLPSLMHNSS